MEDGRGSGGMGRRRRRKTGTWYLVKFGVILVTIGLIAVCSQLRSDLVERHESRPGGLEHVLSHQRQLLEVGEEVAKGGFQESEQPLDRRREISLSSSSSSALLTFGLNSVESTLADVAGSDSKDGEEDSCPTIYGSNSTEKCQFVLTNCEPDGLINYLEFYYCKCANVKALAFIVFLIWLLVLFYLLGHTAEEYFCPTLSKISQALKLAPDVAGITILALGNGAPDVFSVFAAINSGRSGIATGEILGSGNFITTVVMGLVTWTAQSTVPWYQLLRDVGFYLFSLTLSCFIVYNGEVYIWQPIMALVCYVCYVLFTILGNYLGKKKRGDGRSNRGGLVFRDSEHTLIGDEEFVDDYDDESELISMDLFSSNGIDGEEQSEGSSEPQHLPTGGGAGTTGAGRAPHQESFLERIGVVDSSVPSGDERNQAGGQPKQPVYLLPKWLLHHRHQMHHHHPEIGADEVFGNIYDLQKGDFLDDNNAEEESDNSFRARLQRRLERLKYYIEWDEKSKWEKIIYVSTWPFTLWLNLSIPNVERWSRTLRIFNPVFGPLVFLIATDSFSIMLFGVIPLWALVLATGFVASVFTYFSAERGKAPKFLSIWMSGAFLMCIVWIFLIANELVGVLQTMGLILSISESVLGLTVLAMGNSVGDMIADVVVAKEGFPEMAIAACIGGPLFNLLIGLGVSFSWACLRALPSPYIIRMTPQILMGFVFLGTSLLSTMIVVTWNRFTFPRKYGLYLIALYALFMASNLLVEFNVIEMHLT